MSNKTNENIDQLVKDLHDAMGCPFDNHLKDVPKYYTDQLEHIAFELIKRGWRL